MRLRFLTIPRDIQLRHLAEQDACLARCSGPRAARGIAEKYGNFPWRKFLREVDSRQQENYSPRHQPQAFPRCPGAGCAYENQSFPWGKNRWRGYPSCVGRILGKNDRSSRIHAEEFRILYSSAACGRRRPSCAPRLRQGRCRFADFPEFRFERDSEAPLNCFLDLIQVDYVP